jgi:hypothetical protein
MKTIGLTLCTAIFFASAAANAQISSFTVTSRTASAGDQVQIAGLIVSQDSALTISTTPGATFSSIGGSAPFFSLSAGVGGTVLAWDGPGRVPSTQVSSPSAHIVNCSGRFWVQEPTFEFVPPYVDDDRIPHDPTCEKTDSGYGGELEFDVQSGAFFSVTVLTRTLENYGLPTGVIGARTAVRKNGGTYDLAAVSEEGTAPLYFLPPGRYKASVVPTSGPPMTFSCDNGTRSGWILVSINQP